MNVIKKQLKFLLVGVCLYASLGVNAQTLNDYQTRLMHLFQAIKTADTNPLAERINDPSNPHHFWSYRMHLTLSELNQASDFNHKLYKLVAVYRH